jgi:tetratricopeptide (TPR) repeat protein
MYYLFQGFVLQQPEVALKGLDSELHTNPSNPLLLFLSASLAIKNSQSEKALALLVRLKEINPGIEFVYANYQLGEVYLHKGSYELAVSAYRNFLQSYKGQNYVKDTHYKIGVCYWLMSNQAEADASFEKARAAGKETTEADKHAARSLSENNYPNVALSKIRYATDGGYYEVASKLANDLDENDFRAAKDKVEFTYRKARLHHKLNQVAEASALYQKTITQQGTEDWYFAPNACLQLGYLYLEQRNSDMSRNYFEKALAYKKHEYKNSIDSKAKSALAQLKKNR